MREGQTCDLKVFHKKMPEQFLGIRNTITKCYELFPAIDELHRKLLYDKIIERMEILYRHILVSERISPNYLIDFDKELVRKSPEYSKDLDDIMLHSYFNYHYIRNWRNKGYIPLNISIVLLNKILEKLAVTCKFIAKRVSVHKEMWGGDFNPSFCELFVMSNQEIKMVA